MTAQHDPFTDLAGLARLGQSTATDALELWTSTARTGGRQVENLHRAADDLFGLADHSIAAGRVFVEYLTTVLRISAATVDTYRELTGTGLKAVESAQQWVPTGR